MLAPTIGPPRWMCRATLALALFALVPAGACGTLIHPERRGQSSGRIDPGIAILDAIGLLFWIIPGLIAFAVDFSTGAIYMPPGGDDVMDGDVRGLVVVHVDPDSLDRDTLARIVGEHLGRDPATLRGALRCVGPARPGEDLRSAIGRVALPARR